MVGRFVGWILIGLAILSASAEAVMALGNGAYEGLATGEVWTLIAGRAPVFEDTGAGLFQAVTARVMDLPAWVVLGPLGTLLLVLFRRRPKRLMFRHSRTFG